MIRFKKYAAYTLVLVPVVCYFWFFSRYMVNAPINDDYYMLDFVNQYVSANSFMERVKLMLSFSNEHRIVYTRFWTLMTYWINGSVNFTQMAVVGNLGLIAVALVFYKKFKEYSTNILLFLPVTVLLFNMASWENMTFGMAILANVMIILLMLCNLYFLTVSILKPKHLLFAILFFIAAALTHGAGMFLLPVGIFILYRRKEYKKLAIYFLITIVPVILYFYGLQRVGSIPLMDFLYDYKGRAIIFLFAFLGNAFNYFMIHSDQAPESVGITSIIGFALFCLFLYITKLGYYKKNLFNYSIMLLVLIVACVTTYSRVSSGVVMAGASRYRIFGVIFVIALYFWYLETYPGHKRQVSTVVLGSIAYLLGINYAHYEYLSIREKQTLTGILYYNDGNREYLNGDKTTLGTYDDFLKQSAKLGVYTFPSNKSLEYYFPYSEIKRTGSKDMGTSYFSLSLESVTPMSDCQMIEGWGFLDGHSATGQKIYVGLQQGETEAPVFYSARSVPRYDLNPYFNKLNLKEGGFMARIRNKDIKPGENTIWVMVEQDGQVKITKTERKLIL